jgi:hypothetical protein
MKHFRPKSMDETVNYKLVNFGYMAMVMLNPIIVLKFARSIFVNTSLSTILSLKKFTRNLFRPKLIYKIDSLF